MNVDATNHPRVVVAHESEALREAMAHLLRDAAFDVTAASDGQSAVDQLSRAPDVLVLDAAIGGLLSFEVIDHIRAQKLATRTLLVASVYNSSGYKRQPQSLYGADDYVEQHHIPDQLVDKVKRLAAMRVGG